MTRLNPIPNQQGKVGNVPGQIIYTGKKTDKVTALEVFDFNANFADEFTVDNLEDFIKIGTSESVTWYNVNGLNDEKLLEEVSHRFELHPLVMEDVANTRQRPKLDEYKDYLFAVFKMLYFNSKNELEVEHISFILGEDFVVTLQENDEDVFEGVRDRIRNAKGRIRTLDADYLLFALMDAVIDNYFTVIETISDRIEELEDQLFNEQEENMSAQILQLKKEVIKVRRSIFPLREVVSRLEKADNSLISERTKLYLRDLYDHTIQVIETIEGYRDSIASLMDLNMTNISNRMNEVMKVLTIMATLFIPTTFLAGIYGMNFDYIPELKWKYSYFVFWGLLLIIFAGMLYYFKRKKWL